MSDDSIQDGDSLLNNDSVLEQQKADAERARRTKAKRLRFTMRQDDSGIHVSFDKESEFKKAFAAFRKEVNRQPLFFNDKVVHVQHTINGFAPAHKGQLNRLAKKHDFVWQDETKPISDEGSEANCILYPRSMRSGKKIEYEGHVVVMGDLHPTAEVIAGGSIVVWGAIHGIVHAGASGNEQSVIVGLQFDPQQIRIDDCLVLSQGDEQDSGDDEQEHMLGFYPQVAYLRGDEIVLKDWEKGSLMPSVFGKVIRHVDMD